MPTYDYQCQTCELIDEHICRIAERLGRSVETIRYTVKRFDHEHPDDAVFPASDGRLRPELEELASRLGCRERVLFLGRVGEADLASVYANAKILSEALPFMQRYDNATVVVKYGGHAMGEEALADQFGRDIALLVGGPEGLAECALAARCPHFGLLVGSEEGVSALGVVGHLVQHSRDVRAALLDLDASEMATVAQEMQPA